MAVGKGVSRGESFVSAQFSIPYVVACCLLDREMGPGQLLESRLADESLLEFSKKVTVRYDDELNRMYPDRTASRVEISLKGGRKLVRQVEIPRGDPRDPMTWDDVAGKVRRFAAKRNPGRIDEAIRLVQRIDSLSDIREWTETI